MAKKKTRTVIVGIDPGFSGAIAFFDSATRQLKIRDLPIKKIMNRRQIDARAFSQIIILNLQPLRMFTLCLAKVLCLHFDLVITRGFF